MCRRRLTALSATLAVALRPTAYRPVVGAVRSWLPANFPAGGAMKRAVMMALGIGAVITSAAAFSIGGTNASGASPAAADLSARGARARAPGGARSPTGAHRGALPGRTRQMRAARQDDARSLHDRGARPARTPDAGRRSALREQDLGTHHVHAAPLCPAAVRGDHRRVCLRLRHHPDRDRVEGPRTRQRAVSQGAGRLPAPRRGAAARDRGRDDAPGARLGASAQPVHRR